jgi:hypothetical protein
MPKRSKRRGRTRRKRKQRGGSTIPICIYSHSEYFDVLQIQMDYLTKLFKGSQQPIYLFADKNYDKPVELTYKTILYDGNASYMQRLATSIEQVPEPYFILSHDNDILIHYDAPTIGQLIASMKEHKIDCIQLTHNDKNKGTRIKITDTLYIAPHSKDDPYAFSVRPRLWERGVAKEFFSANSGKGYIHSENNNVQKYIKEKIATYELVSEKSIQSHFSVNFGCPTSPEYVFIHITNTGKFTANPRIKGTTVDPLIQAEIDEIQKKYIDGSSRGQW